MTYHMEQMHVLPYIDNQNYNDANKVNSKYTFPYKLWEILNDTKTKDSLLWWSADGLRVEADPVRYEHFVMVRYPEFVRIPTFANFRRQMRWYNFEWEIDDSGLFHFAHPDFQKGREDILPKVLPRMRGTGRRPPSPKYCAEASTQNKKRFKRADYDQLVCGDNSDNSVASDVLVKCAELKNDTGGKASCTVATQTAFTMSPHNTEFIGTVNDGLHYYDFYTYECMAQAYAGFYNPCNAYYNCGAQPLPNEVTMFNRGAPNSGHVAVNMFAGCGADQMGSPEQLCLQGYQKPVVSDAGRTAAAAAPTDDKHCSGSTSAHKENFMDL